MEQFKREQLTVARERAILVSCLLPNDTSDPHDPLNELRALADTAGAIVADELMQKRNKPEPATYIGSGKVQELREMADAQARTSSSSTTTFRPRRSATLKRWSSARCSIAAN